jgi:fructose-bisphosphate aldolase class II
MPIVDLGTLLTDATRDGYGLLAANVILLEHAEAIVDAAAARNAPVVLQVSQNAVRYHGDLAPLGRACLALAEAAPTRVALHLDHATTLDLCRTAADLGFGSVMFDASDAPAAENVARTAAAARWAHDRGIVIEAEIGIVGGKDGDHRAAAPTEPGEARAFVERTGVDALAVQVGTTHARTTRTGTLDLPRVGALRSAVPVPLVLHGSSGVADDQLAAGIAHGLVKINVGTRFNVALTGAVRDHLTADPGVVDPRRYLADGRVAMRDVAASLLDRFGASGRG